MPVRRDVVEKRRALIGSGLHQIDEQPGIVELAVVDDAARRPSVLIVGRRASVSSRERISEDPNPYLPASAL